MKEAVLVEVGERRVYFRDVKPYHAPESLADLRGPTSGRVFLPKTVWWAPGDGWIDIDEPGGTSLAYRVVITEGQPENQIAVLNAETLKKSGATSCYLSGFELCGKQNFRNFAMAQSRAEFDSQFQHRITREALAAVGEFGFVLAGAGALREHGLIDRPTEDIDLFTIQKHEQDFPHAVDTLMTTLRDAGLEVTATQVTDSFARLHVSDRRASAYTTIDMGVDWRSSAPATLQVGAVLAEIDSVASKVAALYSRGEPRDFLDVDRIRQSGRFSDEELLEVAVNFDPGFDRSYFAHRLIAVSRVAAREVHEYGISSSAFESIVKRLEAWGHQLSNPHTSEEPGMGPATTIPNIPPPANPIDAPGKSGPGHGLDL